MVIEYLEIKVMEVCSEWNLLNVLLDRSKCSSNACWRSES